MKQPPVKLTVNYCDNNGHFKGYDVTTGAVAIPSKEDVILLTNPSWHHESGTWEFVVRRVQWTFTVDYTLVTVDAHHIGTFHKSFHDKAIEEIRGG